MATDAMLVGLMEGLSDRKTIFCSLDFQSQWANWTGNGNNTAVFTDRIFIPRILAPQMLYCMIELADPTSLYIDKKLRRPRLHWEEGKILTDVMWDGVDRMNAITYQSTSVYTVRLTTNLDG